MGDKSTSCLLEGFISTLDSPVSDLPVELQIFRNTYSDISYASLYGPFSVQSGNCLSNCEAVKTCTQEVDQYYRPIPADFNETIYGPECALELGKKSEELETTGLLSRIGDEVAFLDCFYVREGYVFVYVYVAQQITFN